MVGWVGWRAVGWVGGWRSFRAWVNAFVPVGGGAVIFFGATTVFCSRRSMTGLLWRSSSTKQRIRLLLYCCSMVGGLVGWCIDWSVGGCVMRYVSGVLSANWKRLSCWCGCCVVCCLLSLLPNADVVGWVCWAVRESSCAEFRNLNLHPLYY